MNLLSNVLQSLTAVGAKKKMLTTAVESIVEKTDGKAHPVVVSEISKEVVGKLELPWFYSKRMILVVFNSALWLCNDYFKMGLDPESLQHVTAGILTYIVGKTYEQSR